MSRAPKCPGVVTAAAVLLFVYGSFMLIGSCCGGIGVMGMFGDPPAQAAPGQLDLGDMFGADRNIAKEVPSYFFVQSGVTVFNLLGGAAMILAGIGALQLRPWARMLGSAAASLDVLIGLAELVYTVIFIVPVADGLFAEEANNMPPGFGNLMEAGIWINTCFSLAISMALCVPILITLNLKKSRDAFAGKLWAPLEDRDSRRDDYDDDDDRPSRSPQSPGDTGITARPD